MKIIFKIAKTELRKLFYSPIAWLIIIIFTLQCALKFTDNFDEILRNQQLGYHLSSITDNLFSAQLFGLFSPVLSYLYLYIPLLTMGVMSQEIGNGSIKLLYSSPVTNKQIILGKYLGLVLFGITMIAILIVFSLYGIFAVNHVDVPLIICGLLGIFLLICAYAAIGLFMSSLTSYAVVAAMGTLGILALLNFLKGVGQNVEGVRDVTYWVGISGRADTFIRGMVTSEDILYFLIVIGLFITLTLIRLQSGRQKFNKISQIGKYVGICVVALFIGFLSSRPKLKYYADVTNDKHNTLTKGSQEVLSKLTDGLTITTYVNMLEPNYWLALPADYKEEEERFEQYIRFKPNIKLKYVYYYHRAKNDFLDKQYPNLSDKQRMDTLIKLNNFKFDIIPYSALSSKVDLSAEKFRLVRLLETDNGKKTFLRVFEDNSKLPSEREITAAFKRLTTSLPTVGFVTGQGERGSKDTFDEGYEMISGEKTFRYAFINQGFDFRQITLDQPVSKTIRILVISSLQKSLTPLQQSNLHNYISDGGNMIILGEPGTQGAMNPTIEELGVKFIPGVIAKKSARFQPGLLVESPTKAGESFSFYLSDMAKYDYSLTMPGAVGIELTKTKIFNAVTLFEADSSFITDQLTDTDKLFAEGRNKNFQSYPTVVALSRKLKKKTQKIIVTGDADWLDNSELLMSRNGISSANYYLITAAFYWLSDNEVPIDMRRTPGQDKSVAVGPVGWSVASIILKWGLTILLIISAIIIWIRRRAR
jgi:ABC-2 type transport system permease protein